MSKDKVVPFRPRPPSTAELLVYKSMTRTWHPEVQQLMLPRPAPLPQDKIPPRRR